MTGYFARKPSTIKDVERAVGFGTPQPIKVIAEVTLSKEKYKAFTEDMLDDYDFIAEHTQNTGAANGFMRCILIKRKGTKHKAIAVDSEGFNYARYAAIVKC